MKKANKFFLASISSILSVSIGCTFGITLSNIKMDGASNSQNNISNSNDLTIDDKIETTNEQEKVKPLVPLDYNSSLPLIVQDTGPIISQKSTITSLDWFGSERWSINLETAELDGVKFLPNNVTSSNWVEYFDSAMVNYALDRTNNHLWVLSNTLNSNSKNLPKQKLMQIDSENGKILMIKEINYSGDKNKLYRKIQVLDSGNVMIYSHGQANFDLYTKNDGRIISQNYDEAALTKNITSDITSMGNKATKTFSFLFSISPNVNIALFTPEAWNGDVNNLDKSGKIYFAYVDDNLNLLSKTSEWNTAIDMKNDRTNMTDDTYEVINSSGTKSTKKYIETSGDSFPKITYKLPDNRTLVTIYNKLYIFWPTQDNNKPTYKEFDLNVDDGSGKYRPIESWTTDTGNNLYVKFAGDTKIQKIEISGTTVSDTNIKLSTYYDLSGSPTKEISDNAKNFVMYNVYGYSGQIMLLNPIRISRNSVPNLNDSTTSDKFTSYNFGLAAAIVDSKTSVGQGDSKGLLNTDKAFTKSSTFDIPSNILKNKLPSEISRQDLEITENGFLTKNNTIDGNTGQLKYKQFEKLDIDDKGKTFKVVVNIDQIPWFVNNNVMPSNIPPLTITKQFSTESGIDTRITWKDVNLDYDFKNTLPSKVTSNDIKRFDPFGINITSQSITIDGENYPKKSYEIVSHDDDKGIIVIKAIIEYLPIDVESNKTNVLKQEFTHQYEIFKKNDHKDFNFIGTSNNKEEDIKNIPQLKELSQSNLLPSSFNSSDIDSILKFVNTDTSSGYPLSKMNFNVIADDITGKLTITGKIQDGYYEDTTNNVEFSKTYIGLNKVSDYLFDLNTNPTNFNKKEFRPSEIDEQMIYKNFVKYQGFNSSDIKLILAPNDSDGTLIVNVNLINDYPNNVLNNVGFIKNDGVFSKTFTITGFKTTNEYQQQYSVIFKDDNDIGLDDIKKYTPNQIKQILENHQQQTENKLYIDGKIITSEKDFALSVIASKGSNIPTDSLDNNFEAKIYYNDTNGEITIKLTYKNIIGLTDDLIFIQRYTGFAKGNQIPTGDILSFKTQAKLFFDNSEFNNILPSEIKTILNDNSKRNDEIKKFLSFYSGDYLKAIESNNYDLEVISDDIFGYITIKIIFNENDISNKQSLLTYTVTYSGFKTE